MFSNTYLIGKHLIEKSGLTDIINCLEKKPCCLCKIEDYPVLPRKGNLSSGFMDARYVDDSECICIYCLACIGFNQGRSDWLRTTSFIANRDSLIRLKRDDLWGYLSNPPKPPFVMAVTYSHKKHLSYKAVINLTTRIFNVRTDNSNIEIVREDDRKLMDTIQNWYTVCEDKKTEPTWFTKDEILNGTKNMKKIERYGVKKFISESNIIEPYRRTAKLELFTHCVNKKPFKERD